MNNIKGIDKIMVDFEDLVMVYTYKGNLWSMKQLVRRTKDVWTEVETNEEKYELLGDTFEWDEIPEYIEADLAAHLFDKYYITTNGQVFRDTPQRPISQEIKGLVRILLDGERKRYRLTDLLIKGFMLPELEIGSEMTYVSGNMEEEFKRGITLETAELKDQEYLDWNESTGRQERRSKQYTAKFGNMNNLKKKRPVDFDRETGEVIEADPSPQPITTAPEEPQAREVLFGTTPEISIPTPQYNERYEEPMNLNGSAPQTKIITVSGRQKRRFN